MRACVGYAADTLAVIVTAVRPILNVKEQKTYDFRWISVYVTAQAGWQLAVG